MSMGTSFEQIKSWVENYKEEGYKYMIVMVDTFDYDDYPIGFKTGKECLEKYNNPGEMQRVEEVYDLSMDIDIQMNEVRAHHLPQDIESCDHNYELVIAEVEYQECLKCGSRIYL